jgi:hypothetical protein
MNVASMLADFAVRMALGLAVSLLLTSWRAVPLPFFRTQAHVILGLLVLAGLDLARSDGQSWTLTLLVAGAVLAYLCAVAWGLGLPFLGIGAAAAIVLATLCWLGAGPNSVPIEVWALNTASRVSSGFYLGTTLTAMLLGHYYLTAPAMSIDPLTRLVGLVACALLTRALLAGVSLWVLQHPSAGWSSPSCDSSSVMFLAARWGMGFVGAAVATYMAWRTARIRSTQSATGILYIAMIFVLFGELTSMILAGRTGIAC